jgi:hypothetical protein
MRRFVLLSFALIVSAPPLPAAAMRAPRLDPNEGAVAEAGGRGCDDAGIRFALQTSKHVQLGPGEFTICTQIELLSDMTLEGAGKATVLNWAGTGDYAIRIGDLEQTIFGCHLRNLTIRGGGLLVRRAAASNTVENVWIGGAPVDGVRIQAKGEWTKFRDVTVYGAGLTGFRIMSSNSNTGFVFDHCQAQNNGGAGFRFETTSPTASLAQVTLRDCVSQANGRHPGQRSAEIVLRGYVLNPTLENCWIGDTPHEYGIRTYQAAPGRRVTGLTISNVTMANVAHAALLYAAPQCYLDSLRASSSVGDVHYYRFAPLGLMRLSPGLLVEARDPNG